MVGGKVELARDAQGPRGRLDALELDALLGLVGLDAIEPFDEAKYQSERETYSSTLLDRRASELLQAWVAELRATAKIEDRRGPRV